MGVLVTVYLIDRYKTTIDIISVWFPLFRRVVLSVAGEEIVVFGISGQEGRKAVLCPLTQAASRTSPSRRAISSMADESSSLHCLDPHASGSILLSTRAAIRHSRLMKLRPSMSSNRGETTIRSISLHSRA